MAVASTFNRHLVLIGWGIWFRVMETLVDTGQKLSSSNRPQAQSGRGRATVGRAGYRGRRPPAGGTGGGTARARCILLCTQNDAQSANCLSGAAFESGYRGSSCIFDDQFADDVAPKFGFRALSATLGYAGVCLGCVGRGRDRPSPSTADHSVWPARLFVAARRWLVRPWRDRRRYVKRRPAAARIGPRISSGGRTDCGRARRLVALGEPKRTSG